MNPSDLAKILDDLGQRLGPTGEHVFQLAVKQQVINGAMGVIALSITFVVGLVIAILTLRRRDDAGWQILSVSWFACWALVAVMSIGMIATSLLNPEYAALKEILYTIKP